MFDIKCIYCKHFNPKDGCEKNLEEEGCSLFEEIENSYNIDYPPSDDCPF